MNSKELRQELLVLLGEATSFNLLTCDFGGCSPSGCRAHELLAQANAARETGDQMVQRINRLLAQIPRPGVPPWKTYEEIAAEADRYWANHPWPEGGVSLHEEGLAFRLRGAWAACTTREIEEHRLKHPREYLDRLAIGIFEKEIFEKEKAERQRLRNGEHNG